MKTINQMTGMPRMSVAFAGWMTKITFIRITQSLVNGFTIDNEENITFEGTIQPLNPKMIALKPEGQRDWGWLQVHCFAVNLQPQPNDRFLYNNQRYKIMATKDYSLNNFVEYHVVEDFRPD